MDEIIISDADPWVEKVTVQNLQEELSSNVIGADQTIKRPLKTQQIAL